MKRTIFLSIGLLFLCWGAAPAAQSGSVKIESGGVKRTYEIHLPHGYQSAKKYPLMVCLHGRYGKAKRMPDFTGFNRLGSREGFIVVYPQGYKRSWADARGVTKASEKGIDDVAFLDAVLDDVEAKFSVEPSQIYFSGISNGGMMSFTYACQRAERIAGIAVLAANLPEELQKSCEAAATVPVLLLNGTADPILPYEGGEVKKRQGGILLSADSTMGYWAMKNELTYAGKKDLPDHVGDGTNVYIHSWKNSKGKTIQQLYEIQGGGHTWPGKAQYLPEKMVGRVCQEFDGSEVIWDFLRRHRRAG